MRSSMRARAAPRQWWAPKPNEIGFGSGRSSRSSSASVQRRLSRFAAPIMSPMLSPRRIVDAGDVEVGGGLPAADLGGRVEAQQLLDGVVDQIGAVAKERALFRVAGQRDEGVAEHPGDGLVAGEEQEGDHGDDLVVVEGVPVVGGGEGGDQVVSGFVGGVQR